jgi:hypothetical protein
MRMTVLVAILLTASSSHAAESIGADPGGDGLWFPVRWQQPTKTETALLVAASLAVTVDVLQSLDIKRHPWAFESNPFFFGDRPSDLKLILIGELGSITAMTGIWYAMPSGWRNLVPLTVLGAEVAEVYYNHKVGLRITF